MCPVLHCPQSFSEPEVSSEPVSIVFPADEYAVGAAACGVLHNVFYCKPTASYLAEIRESGLLEQWPEYGANGGEAIERIMKSLRSDDPAAIERDYYQLYIGPGMMNAYPWGSVYTDHENLVCGETTREFKRFCEARGINFQLAHSEPEDHIGLVAAALSRLFDQAALDGSSRDIALLLADHVLPWSHRVLDKTREHAQTGYYLGFAQLYEGLLAHWQQALGITPRELDLFA